MIRVNLQQSRTDLHVAQSLVTQYHYLHAPVSSRCSPMAYHILLHDDLIGVMIYGRPQSTCCYQGPLTYGGICDVMAGRAKYDRWTILNLARVWLDPRVQTGGMWYTPELLPGYVDRNGVWRSTLASHVVKTSLTRVNRDYLLYKPPVYMDDPYEIRVVLSYCDTRVHRGTLYAASGFRLARHNRLGIETWYTSQVRPLSADDHMAIKSASAMSRRAAVMRGKRSQLSLQI